MTQDKNMPAFPACNEENVNGTMGMSLRDYFAAQASEEDIREHREFSLGEGLFDEHWVYTREQAKYRYADAMMEARK